MYGAISAMDVVHDLRGHELGDAHTAVLREDR